MNLKECKMYFLEEAYYKQRITNEKSAMPLVHGLNDMQNLNSKAVETCVSQEVNYYMDSCLYHWVQTVVEDDFW